MFAPGPFLVIAMRRFGLGGGAEPAAARDRAWLGRGEVAGRELPAAMTRVRSW
jgi:hypothetical protein